MHEYFDWCVAQPEHWRSASLRDPAQLSPPGVTYDAVMDAARVRIEAFYLSDALDGDVDATQIDLPIHTTTSALYARGRVIKIGSETMTVVARVSSTVIQVTRGTYGTTAEAHANGAFIYHASNNLKQQTRVALGTTDGHDYLAIWDAYWTASYLGLTFKHKAFQFTTGGPDAEGQIWMEPSVIYGPGCGPGFVGAHNYRWYNKAYSTPIWSDSTGDQVGPGTQCDPDEPQSPFCVAVGKWTRFWFLIQQRANDYDVVTAWVADEDRGPHVVFHELLVSVRPTGKYPNSMLKFWVEFNSSTDEHQRLDERDLIAYVRNLVVLRDVPSVLPYLLRPEAGVPTPWRPRAPGKPILMH